MPGCCVVAALLFLGPRVVLVLAWLLTGWFRAFDSMWIAVLGFLFLPWTSLAWMYTYFQRGGDVGGGYLLLLVLAVLVDFSAYGGARRRRD
jgi:hypothetical protein